MITSDYITIQLSKGQETIVDPIDADLKDLHWYAKNSGNAFYAYRGIWKENRTKQVPMHRIILSRMIERDLSSDEYADHINGNTLDNRRSNLRLADSQTNTFNTRKHMDNKTGYKGVAYDKANDKWRAEIMIGGKKQWLGRFNTPEDAAIAYNHAALKYHGEFASFNDIDGWQSITPQKYSGNKSGCVGVRWDDRTGKWAAQIYKGRSIFLGRFNNIEDAIEARLRAEKEYK